MKPSGSRGSFDELVAKLVRPGGEAGTMSAWPAASKAEGVGMAQELALIEHIVALSEAYDSGLCGANAPTLRLRPAELDAGRPGREPQPEEAS